MYTCYNNLGDYMDLKDKVALVTGASRGIGAAIVKELAKRGCNIIINYNNSSDRAENLREYIVDNYKIKSIIVKSDVSEEQEVINLVNTSIKEFDKIDFLINNAGIAIDTLFEDKTVNNFKRILDVNLIGTFLVSKYVGRHMLKNKIGKIVNISSTNGIDTFYPMSLDYDASKAGVISLTHNLALEYAPYINVNAIASGWVNTEMNKEMDEELVNLENSKIALGRFAEPEEIAKVAVFLCSDDASYINSAVIRVDGGVKNV